MSEILAFVPIGADNAKPSRDIWKAADIWAETTFSNKLNKLTETGAIRRRPVKIATGYMHVYWRDEAARDRNQQRIQAIAHPEREVRHGR